MGTPPRLHRITIEKDHNFHTKTNKSDRDDDYPRVVCSRARFGKQSQAAMLASGPASRLVPLQTATWSSRQRQNVSLFRAGRFATTDRAKRFRAPATANAVELVKELKLISGAHCIPHPEKAATGGEDAHFTSTTDGGAMGVADGVGGWADSGISPADYSRGFMRIIQNFLDGNPMDGVKGATVNTSPQTEGKQDNELLKDAFEAAHSALRIPGSCTACVVRLDQDAKRFDALNLGDSGFMLVRKGRIVFKSPPMQHFFDCPCQFGAYPEYVDMTDEVDDAEEFGLRAKQGDIIVMATDGLWDNCTDEEIIELLPKNAEGIDDAVVQIAQRASSHSQDENFDSPYCQSAREMGFDLPWYEKLLKAKIIDGRFECGKLTGGKWDDITVVLGYVDSVPVPPEPLPEVLPEPSEIVSGDADVGAISEMKSEGKSKEMSSGDPLPPASEEGPK